MVWHRWQQEKTVFVMQEPVELASPGSLQMAFAIWGGHLSKDSEFDTVWKWHGTGGQIPADSFSDGTCDSFLWGGVTVPRRAI